MSAMTRRSSVRLAIAALAAAAVVLAIALHDRASGDSSATATPAANAGGLTVGLAPITKPLPAGFAGLSMEYKGFLAYAGANPRTADPAFEQLLRDIAPNQSPVLRIGGDSSDWSWWPVPGMTRPPGVRFDLTPSYLATAKAVVTALHGRLLLGLNLEAGSARVAAAEARAFVAHIGASSLAALELGNEPELYASFGWYRSARGVAVPGRAKGYDVPALERDYATFSHALPPIPLAGPSSGAPTWLASLGSFLGAEPRVRLATVHAYPLKHCRAATVVTIGQLLADASSAGLATSVRPYAVAAARHGVPLRVDEMNGVSCGGYRGVSDTFASALWVLDTLFEMDKLGVGGVNIHTVPGGINEIIGAATGGGRRQISVHPEFYGMMLFAQAAPAGSRLLQISAPAPAGVKVWATKDTDGDIRVVVINKGVAQPVTVRLGIPSAQGPATVIALRAPSVRATTGVTLGGQTFGAQTSTGIPTGRRQSGSLAASGSTYAVRVPPATATMLTLAAR
jgi:hypothetical protein